MQLFNLCLFFFWRNMSRVNPMTQSDKTSQLETGPLFKPDFRQTCSLHRSSELSCTFYPELFPPTILCNHLCVLLRLCDLTQHSYYQGQQSKKRKKLPTFRAKQALLYTLATWLMKMSENPEKNMTWSHTSFIGKLMIPGLRITAFHWLLNTLPHPQ